MKRAKTRRGWGRVGESAGGGGRGLLLSQRVGKQLWELFEKAKISQPTSAGLLLVMNVDFSSATLGNDRTPTPATILIESACQRGKSLWNVTFGVVIPCAVVKTKNGRKRRRHRKPSAPTQPHPPTVQKAKNNKSYAYSLSVQRDVKNRYMWGGGGGLHLRTKKWSIIAISYVQIKTNTKILEVSSRSCHLLYYACPSLSATRTVNSATYGSTSIFPPAPLMMCTGAPGCS